MARGRAWTIAALVPTIMLLGLSAFSASAIAGPDPPLPKPDPPPRSNPPPPPPAPPPPSPVYQPPPSAVTPVAPAVVEPAPVVVHPTAAERRAASVRAAARRERVRRAAAQRRKEAAAARRAAAADRRKEQARTELSAPGGAPESSPTAILYLLVGFVAAMVLLGLAVTPASVVPWRRASRLLDDRRDELAVVGSMSLVATVAFFLLVQATT